MFLNVKDAMLSYDVFGYGEPLLLLHGNGEDKYYFINQLDFLKMCGFQVYILEMRSHGSSTNGKLPLDFHVFAHDVVRFLDHIKIKNIHILGFSDGANTAMQVAIQYPQYVKSLILNSGNISFDGLKKHVQCMVQAQYYALSLGSKLIKKLKVKRDIIGLMSLQSRISIEQLKKIHQRTLVIVGEDDMVKETHSRLIYSSLPNAHFHVIKNGNHFIAYEMSEVFNEVVVKFLRRV